MINKIFPLAELEKSFNFKEFERVYYHSKSWGILTSIDLKECNEKTIRSHDHLKRYLVDLCNLIDMKRFGEPTIVFFGEEAKVMGYSITQLIETSLISGHFANETNSAFIDIFSCKIYDPMKAAHFTKDFFEATSAKVGVILRD